MASAFGHALAAITIGKSFSKQLYSWKFWVLGVICSILPDADVVSFTLGIPYEHVSGHRGFTHSILFAIILGVLVTGLFYRKVALAGRKGLALILFFALSTLSHAILDAMTTGGLGVAFFAPFENSRYFFPWRPIQVSPIGVGNFLGEAGLRVLKSEAIWVGIPCLSLLMVVHILRRTKRKTTD